MTRNEAEALLLRLRQLLRDIPDVPPAGKGKIREEVLRLAEIIEGIRRFAKIRLGGLTNAKAARDRILAYLKLFVGTPIDAKELQVVGGIQEFARRIRELRVQMGYRISTGYSRPDLRPDEYVLESAEPSAEEAERWRIVNGIRKQKGGARDRILALFKAFVGKPITGEEIAYVADIREAPRRVRELRRELGWRVVTKQSGRPDLPAGTYILETLEPLPEHDREIPDAIYDAVLDRDGCKCRCCGWSVEQRNPSGKRQFLEVHHVVHHAHGGQNNKENLITLCNVHHDSAHRDNVEGKEFFSWLKRQSR